MVVDDLHARVMNAKEEIRQVAGIDSDFRLCWENGKATVELRLYYESGTKQIIRASIKRLSDCVIVLERFMGVFYYTYRTLDRNDEIFIEFAELT